MERRKDWLKWVDGRGWAAGKWRVGGSVGIFNMRFEWCVDASCGRGWFLYSDGGTRVWNRASEAECLFGDGMGWKSWSWRQGESLLFV